MRLSVRKIGRYSYHGLAFSAGRSIASMMAGWLCAAFRSLRSWRFLKAGAGHVRDEVLDVGALAVERAAGGRPRTARAPAEADIRAGTGAHA